MKIFKCPHCGVMLSFENLKCGCGAEVAYDFAAGTMVPAQATCGNRDRIGCNWVAAGGGALCASCAMTEVIPDTFHGENLSLWSDAEECKRWVLANLSRWGWFLPEDDGPRPVFHLLSEKTAQGDVNVTMGHADGIVTINVVEADPAERVQRREALGERLRTMTAHFRHELGHYFFFYRLQPLDGFTPEFRGLFGDERAGYGAALEKHYREGPPPDWQEDHLSEYASSHPHEDWAETFAHLLHLTDITDSFVQSDLTAPMVPGPDYDAYRDEDPERLIALSVDLGISLNHINRSMGLPDIYPFVLTASPRGKMAFAHRWMRGTAQRPTG